MLNDEDWNLNILTDQLLITKLIWHK